MTRAALKTFLLGTALPAVAVAQDFEIGDVPKPKAPPPIFTSSIEGGFGYQSANSYFFARYGGRPDRGPFGFLDATISHRDPWDRGARFWDARATFNGQELRAVSARYGVQGQWRLAAVYEGFTRYFSESARTPFDGAGTARLTLPNGWLSQASSLLFRSLPAALKPLDLKVKWQTAGGDYVMTPREGYEVRLHFDHRHREGQRGQSITFGPEALFPVGVFFPQPVDYDSNRVTASLGYAARTWNWRAAYEFASFHNAVPSVLVRNPYSRSLGLPWPAGAFAGYPFAVGQYSLPPDNTVHQASLSGGVALTPVMRLSAKIGYTVQAQNDPFLPYTTSPNLTVLTPLPSSSLNGSIHRIFANATLTARQGKDVDFSAAYTFDDRDNRTPQRLFNYVPNEGQDQAQPIVPGVSRYIRFNLPHSFTFHQAKAEIGYRLAARTRLSVTYTGDFRSRTYQEVTQSNEHALRVKAQSTFAKGSAWVAYTYANRTGSDYNDAAAWDASHTLNYLNAGPQNQSIEYPLLRKYNLADRRRHEAKAGGTWDVAARLTASGSFGYARDSYSRSQVGLQRASTLLGDADLTYALQKHVTASAYYTFERIQSDQRGYFIANTVLNNPAQFWTSGSRDVVHTAGAKVDWQASPKWKLEVTGYVTQGTTRIDTRATPFTPLAVTTPLPDAHANTQNLGLRADYAVRDDLTVRAAYTLEHHVTDDWRYIASLTPVAQILGSGELPPRYTAHVVWLSVRTEF